jgi:SAM-dependent methyltransferase
MDNSEYVHGYSKRESERLSDQANTLSEILHHDTTFPPGSRVLEFGCAVGATTLVIARKNPDTHFIATDVSEESLAKASILLKEEGIENVELIKADVYDLPFANEIFDHVFGCFVLEHLDKPIDALSSVSKTLKSGGSITSIEGDHGSVFFYPHSQMALEAIRCQIRIQAEFGGNSEIGRELFPLLTHAGFSHVHVSPRMVYVDSSRPSLITGFTKNTFTAMIEGVRGDAIRRNLMTESDFDEGIRGLYRAAEKDGVFCYTFFKATGFQN